MPEPFSIPGMLTGNRFRIQATSGASNKRALHYLSSSSSSSRHHHFASPSETRFDEVRATATPPIKTNSSTVSSSTGSATSTSTSAFSMTFAQLSTTPSMPTDTLTSSLPPSTTTSVASTASKADTLATATMVFMRAGFAESGRHSKSGLETCAQDGCAAFSPEVGVGDAIRLEGKSHQNLHPITLGPDIGHLRFLTAFIPLVYTDRYEVRRALIPKNTKKNMVDRSLCQKTSPYVAGFYPGSSASGLVFLPGEMKKGAAKGSPVCIGRICPRTPRMILLLSLPLAATAAHSSHQAQ
ncbi:hypothetical protein IW262DRAFT_1549190 [Armillaria fumosa]|nr:hypothetical protein IW262DRAFT_1549190 [Armillaria fumosa]